MLNEQRMTRWMHRHPDFERVLHIAHREWHGIRHATAYAPGHKLLISAERPLDTLGYDEIERSVENLGIDRVVFQGYSEAADQLALRLRATFGPAVMLTVITHVSTTQFWNNFEMGMQARLLTRMRYGTIAKLGSVKPRFSEAIEGYWRPTIVNFAPNLPQIEAGELGTVRSVLIPLDVDWRKNMFTNIIAALGIPTLDEVRVVNYPNGLESIVNLERLRLVGYLRGNKLFNEMANCTVAMMATLAECQPMTQLEAYAVGTPALTRRLGLEEFADEELTGLTEIDLLDDPTKMRRALERLIDARVSDPAGMDAMIRSHLERRTEIAFARYAEFLDLGAAAR